MNHFIKHLTLSLCISIIIPAHANQSTYQDRQSKEDIQKIFNFLVGKATFTGDGKFMTVPGKLPRSYYSTADYWGGYICNELKSEGLDCNVTDIPRMEGDNFVLNGGADNIGSSLQVERVDATYGTDIYDAATWQIAIALAANDNLGDKQELYQYVENTNKRLALSGIRAIGAAFQYGYNTVINEASQAYAYRMLGDNFLEVDPLADTQYSDYIHFQGSDDDQKKLFGKISWQDWKPITGENAWAFFIGPLQADYLKYIKPASNKEEAYIPYNATSIQNALPVLTAMQAMQTKIGGIYYAAGGSEGNEGPIAKGEISTENNASLLAGLKIFKQVLEKTNQYDPKADKEKITHAIKIIDVMIDGGQLSNGKTTEGLLNYFRYYAWNYNNNIFIAGGRYVNDEWIPDRTTKPVDVNTWGIAAIGPETIDEWYGAGTAYNVWHNIKSWGSFCGGQSPCDESKAVWGVGFSNLDGNKIMTAEWTYGAINAVRSLLDYYQQSPQETRGIKKEALEELIADEASMTEHVLLLRNDKYSLGHFPSTLPNKYQVELPQDQYAFLYASKRYHIPFGWYANPIPSTASTSWSIMMHYNFNPFVLGGV